MFKANRISGWFGFGGVLVVPVNLDGTRLSFLVDTSAAYCSVTHQTLDKIVAKPTNEIRKIALVGKEVVEVPTLRAANFAVGSVRRENFLVSIVDCPPGFQIDSLLGMDLMGKYRITIATDTATLVLREIPKRK